MDSGIENGSDGKPSALSGGAVKIDDILMMTVTVFVTGRSEDEKAYIQSKTGQIRLDLETADVSFAMLDVKAYEDGTEHIGDDDSALIWIECPD